METNLESEYQLAEDFLLQRNWEEAKKHYETVVALVPDHIDSLNALAKCVAEITPGTTKELIYLRQAYKVNPKDYFTLFNIGNYYYKRGSFRQAQKYYDEALEVDPNHLRTNYNMAISMDLAGDLEGCSQKYAKVIELDPNNVEAYNNYGIALDRQGKTDEAIEILSAALNRQEQSKIHNNLAVCLKKAGKKKEAIEHYKKALDTYQQTDSISLIDELPDNPFAVLKAVEEQQGSIDNALQQLIEVQEELPDIPELEAQIKNLRSKGAKDQTELRLEHDDYNDYTEQQLRQILVANKNDQEALFRLAIIQFNKEEFQDSLQIFISAQKMNQRFRAQQVNEYIGDILSIQREYKRARMHYLQAGKGMNEARIWIKAGQQLEAVGEWQNALYDYRKATAADQSDGEAHFKLGNALLMTNNKEEGVIELEHANSLIPNRVDIMLKLGEGLLKLQEQYNRAFDVFNQTLQIDNENIDAHIGLARSLEKLKRVQEARQQFQRLVEMPNCTINGFFYAGFFYENQSDWPNSIIMFRRCLEIDQNHLQANIHLATVLANSGDLKQATNYFSKAVQQDPNNVDANFALGKLYHASQPDLAEAHYRMVLKWDKDHYKALSQLGLLLYSRKDVQEAVQLLKASVSINPNYPLTLNALGHACLEQKNYNEAMRYYSRTTQLLPNDLKALLGVATCLTELGNPSQAISYYERILKLNNNYFDGHFNIAKAYFNQREYAQAAEHFLQAIRINPRHTESYNRLGNSYLAQKQYQHAEQAFSGAVQLNPQGPEYYYNLGNAQFLQKKCNEAIQSYQKSLEFNPNSAICEFNLGCSYRDLGNKNEAFDHYIRASNLDPKNAECYYQLGILSEAKANYDQAHLYYANCLRLKNHPQCRETKQKLELRWPDTNQLNLNMSKMQRDPILFINVNEPRPKQQKKASEQINQSKLMSERPRGIKQFDNQRNQSERVVLANAPVENYRPNRKQLSQTVNNHWKLSTRKHFENTPRNPILQSEFQSQTCSGRPGKFSQPSLLLQYVNQRNNLLPSERGSKRDHPQNHSRLFTDQNFDPFPKRKKFQAKAETDALLSYSYALPYREVPITGKPGSSIIQAAERPVKRVTNKKNESSLIIS